MDNVSLYNKINSLPEDLKKEVQDFVEFLQTKTKRDSKRKSRAFGSLKGKIQMAEDFDAPMEDFKDYM
jgi:hypothetical protein